MERIIGMNARAALIELQKLTGKTIKTTRMLKLGRWNFEWKTNEDGKTFYRKVRYFETPVTGANKEWCFDNCVVTEGVEKEDGIDLTLTTPKGNERDVYIRFYKNRPYVAPVAETKVEETKEEGIYEVLTRPENAHYLKVALNMKEHGDLNNKRAIRAACSMFDSPKLMMLAIKQVSVA